jgi:NADH oxidase (H2O2-forming)
VDQPRRRRRACARSEATIKRLEGKHDLETRTGVNGQTLLRLADLVGIGRIDPADLPTGATASGTAELRRTQDQLVATQRGIETHLVDPGPWALSMATDPDIVAPVQESWQEMGATLHFNTKLEAILGDDAGHVRGVSTSGGEIACDLVVVCSHKEPRIRLGAEAGLAVGSAGGFVVDETMATSVPGIWAAGDCAEIPHGVSNVPIQGLSGSHAYAQGKVAGVNAAGGQRAYQPVYVPWAMVAGKWMIGGVSFSETLATALGIPYVTGQAQGISRARYFPDVKPVKVKLLAEPDGLRLIGAQMVGGEGIKERADFLAMAVRKGITLRDLATLENVYSPPIGALNEPIAMAAQDALARLEG